MSDVWVSSAHRLVGAESWIDAIAILASVPAPLMKELRDLDSFTDASKTVPALATPRLLQETRANLGAVGGRLYDTLAECRERLPLDRHDRQLAWSELSTAHLKELEARVNLTRGFWLERFGIEPLAETQTGRAMLAHESVRHLEGLVVATRESASAAKAAALAAASSAKTLDEAEARATASEFVARGRERILMWVAIAAAVGSILSGTAALWSTARAAERAAPAQEP